MTTLTTRLIGIALVTLTAPSCGLHTDQGAPSRAFSEGTPIEVQTTCRVVGSAALLDPAGIEVYRHPSAVSTLRLEVKNFPMTCAETVTMKAHWQHEGEGTLVLDVRGEHYAHCLCSVDFAPFVVHMPPEARHRFYRYSLELTRGDVTLAPLVSMTIGKIPEL